MAYAIETKKRKWDRLLESFNDRPSSRPPTATPQNTSVTSLIPTFEEELAKRRRLQASSALSLAQNTSNVSLIENYLPSNRGAFLERLETFRSVTKWHIPSTEPINAAEWAKRGWICVDTDTVACGICRERVYVKIDIDEDQEKEKENQAEEQSEAEASQTVAEDDSYTAAIEVYESIVKKFSEMIVTEHAEGCQWKRRGCDASIQRIEGLLNTSKVITNLRNRYEGLSSNAAKIPKTQLFTQKGDEAEKEIQRFQFEDTTRPDINALRLATCGWQMKSEDVFECRNCFRSLGLWLYRGEEPAMEKLDAIESHLEYCPWRSSAAQQTEVAAAARDDNGSQIGTEKVAGWQLVCQAMKLDNAKKQRKTFQQDEEPRPASAISVDLSSTESVVDPILTPEQREKRMKALLERIKSVKKPFNVKSLLKKRKEAKA